MGSTKKMDWRANGDVVCLIHKTLHMASLPQLFLDIQTTSDKMLAELSVAFVCGGQQQVFMVREDAALY